MKKISKRLTSCILIVIMLFSVLPLQAVAEIGETAIAEYETSEVVQIPLSDDEAEADLLQTVTPTASAELFATGQVMEEKPVSYVRPHGFDKDDVDGWVNKSSVGSFVTPPELRIVDDVSWLHYSTTYLTTAHALNVIDENSPMIADGQISFEWRTDPETNAAATGRYNFSFGAIVRYVDENNYLHIQYTDTNFALEWRNNGVAAWSPNIPTEYNLDPGTVNTVVAQFVGASVTIYLNGELVGTLTDSRMPLEAGQFGFRNHNVSAFRTRNVYVRDIAYTNLDTAVTDPTFGAYYIRNHSATQEQAEGGFVAQKVVDPTQTLWDIRRGNAIGETFTPTINPQNGNITMTPPGVSHQNFVLFDSPEFVDGAFEVLWTPTSTSQSLGNVNHSIGFLLRYVNETNYVMAQTNVNGQWHLESATNWTSSVQGGVVFETGQEYRIRFEFEENQVLISIDGAEPFALPAAGWLLPATPGKIGFRRHNNWSPNITVRDIVITPADGAYARQTIRHGIGRDIEYDYANITVDTAMQTMEISEGVVYDSGAAPAVQQGLAFGFTPTTENMSVTALLRYTDARNFVRLTLENDDSDVVATVSGARNGRVIEPMVLGRGGTAFVASETSGIKIMLVNGEIWVFQNGEEIANNRLTRDAAPTMIAGIYGFEGPAVLSNIAYLIYDVEVIGGGVIPTPIPFEIKNDDMVVTLNKNFPSVIQYEMEDSGNIMDAQPTGVNVVSIGLMRENLNDLNRPAVDFIPRAVKFEPGTAENYATYTLYIADEDGIGAADGSDDIFEIVVEYRIKDTILEIDTLEIRELQAGPSHPSGYPTYDADGYLIGGPRLKSIAFPGNATASVLPEEAEFAQIAAYWSSLGGYVSGEMSSRGAANWNSQTDIILNLITGQNETRSQLPWPTGNQNRTDRWPSGGTNNYLARSLATSTPMTVAVRSRDVAIAILSNGDISATMINNRSNEVLRFTYNVTVEYGTIVRGEIGDGRHFWRHEPSNAHGGMRNILDQRGVVNRNLDINWALMQDHLPLTQVVLTEDLNNDEKADWQDGAIAYRRALTKAQDRYRGLTTHPIHSEVNRNSVMWCSMNIVSGAGNPFLRTIDITKNLYNLFDGFGQRLYHKGYQAEGHDDNHPDYGNQFGPRQGGLEDFNQMIATAQDYNAIVGVHLNAQHPNADAFYVDPRIHNGRNWWGWVDSSPGISTEADVLSGQLFARLAELDQASPDLHFIYLDVYSEADWVGRHVMHTFENFGWQILTEFGGPMRSFVSGMHWGIDTGYPSQSHNGTTSQIMRFIFNDGQDSFEPERLLRGAMMPRIGAWRGHSYNESVRLFHGVNLPTRFLQQYELLYWNPNEGVAEFSHNVESRRVGDRTHITKDGMLIADLPYNVTYNANGVGMSPAETGTLAWTGFVADARVFVPWTIDIDMYGDGFCEETTVFERAYVYLDAGGDNTWTVPSNWSDNVRLYELTTSGRVYIDTIPIVDGQIAVTGLTRQTGYVVYPQAITPAVQAATEFGFTGNRTMVRDGNFDTEDFTHWNVSSTSNTVNHVRMSNDRQPLLPASSERADSLDLNHLFIEGDSSDARIYQVIDVDPGSFYTASVWARIGGHNNDHVRRVVIRVEDMEGNSLGENFIMRNVQPMRLNEHPFTHHWINAVRVRFEVPADVNQVRYVLEVEATTDPGASVYFNWATMRKFFNPNANDYSYLLSEDSSVVFFEDFENVDEYWGSFFQGGTGTQEGSHGHLTQRFDSNTDPRRWFTPTTNPFGIEHWNVPEAFTHTADGQTFEFPGGDAGFQPFNYVINDTWSFRQHDSRVGRRLRTMPQTLRLEEDTDYKLSFYYRAYHRTTAIDRAEPYFSVQLIASQDGISDSFILNEPLANTPKNFNNSQDGYYFQENMPAPVRVEFYFNTGSFGSKDDPMEGDIHLAFDSHLSGETVLMLDDVKIEIVTEDVLVTSISVSGEDDAATITTEGGTLQMIAEVLPTDATNKEVIWSVTPTGIATISTDGLLTAVANGIVMVRATAGDDSGIYGEFEIAITGQTEQPNLAVITTSNLSDGRVGVRYSQTLVATGTAPILWSLAENSRLPAGLTLNSVTGVISGTPTASGTFTFTVAATNAAGSNTQSLTIRIIPREEPPVELQEFTISFNANGGTGTMQAATVQEGANFTIPANVFTREGYEFTGWNTIANGSGTAFVAGATIRNVTSNMTLFAQWEKIDEVDPPRREWLPAESTNPFVDVPNDNWQNEPVSWAVRNGIATGIANTNPPEFRPNRSLNRETFATFLHRVVGTPEAVATSFADNASISSWARDAVEWGVEAGIILGFTDNTFRPQAVITREQIAAMLFRFAEYLEKDLEFDSATFDAFPDSGQVRPWALEAMQWATYNGLITGVARGGVSRLEPQGNATRAQAVAVIYRFVMEFEIEPPER